MSGALTINEALQSDLMIQPNAAKLCSTYFAARKELIQAGYEAIKAVLAKLKLTLTSARIKKKA